MHHTLTRAGLTVALASLCVLVAGCGDADGSADAAHTPAPAPTALEGVMQLPRGHVGTTDPARLAVGGGSSVRDDSEVFGLVRGGEARAYRRSMLELLHVVNDTIQDEPIVVTYCVMCCAGNAFEARVEGHPRLTFTSGAAWRGAMLMRDEQTRSLWRQLDGLCVAGPLEGRRLVHLSSGRQALWSAWRAAHPRTRIMAADDEAEAARYELLTASEQTCHMPEFIRESLPPSDGRLPNETLVFGVDVGSAPRAWTLEHLAERGTVDEALAGRPISVWYDASVPTAVAFDRRVDGRTLSFERDARGIYDRETRSRWSLDGLATGGTLEGSRLSPVRATRSQWYAWRFVHPKTTLQR